MPTNISARPFDPEFDTGPSPAARQGPALSVAPPRVVVNPFLSLLGLAAWGFCLRGALLSKSLLTVLVLVAGLAAIGFLIQFHCIECGATGFLARWRSHTCDRSRNRRASIAPILSRRWPSPTTQMVLWGYALAIAGVLAGVCWLGRR